MGNDDTARASHAYRKCSVVTSLTSMPPCVPVSLPSVRWPRTEPPPCRAITAFELQQGGLPRCASQTSHGTCCVWSRPMRLTSELEVHWRISCGYAQPRPHTGGIEALERCALAVSSRRVPLSGCAWFPCWRRSLASSGRTYRPTSARPAHHQVKLESVSLRGEQAPASPIRVAWKGFRFPPR